MKYLSYKQSTKEFLLKLIGLSGILFLLIFSKDVSYSVIDTSKLFFSRIFPTLFPFLLLSNYINLSNKDTNNDGALQTISIIIAAFLCGCPSGSKMIDELSHTGKIKRPIANMLLPAVSNLSPAFFVSYLYQYILERQISIHLLFLIVYGPNIMWFLFEWFLFKIRNYNGKYKQVTRSISQNEIENKPSITISSIYAISNIYVTILCFGIINTIFSLITNKFPNLQILPFFQSIFEVTNGLELIHQSTFDIQQKTALLLGLYCFGGISLLFQTKSILHTKELSFIHYVFSKLCHGIMAYLFTYFLIAN